MSIWLDIVCHHDFVYPKLHSSVFSLCTKNLVRLSILDYTVFIPFLQTLINHQIQSASHAHSLKYLQYIGWFFSSLICRSKFHIHIDLDIYI